MEYLLEPFGYTYMVNAMWVSALVGGDETANRRELLVAVLLGEPRGVPVRDLRRAFLEGGVHESEVRVVIRLGVHAGADEVLDGGLDGLHGNLPRHPHVLVHEISVAVLLGGPLAGPLGPRGAVRAGVVLGALEGVEHVHVRGERLLRDHVTDEHHKVIVGKILAALLDVGDLVEEVGGLGIGEVVLRLPVRVGVLEQAHELRSGAGGREEKR